MISLIERDTFLSDIKIVIETIKKAFIKQEGITEEGMATAEDFGDYLLHTGKISEDLYNLKQEEAKKLL